VFVVPGIGRVNRLVVGVITAARQQKHQSKPRPLSGDLINGIDPERTNNAL